MQQEFEALRIDRRGAAATVRMMWPDGRIERFRQFHREFPIALQLLRDDDTVRVVVLTGVNRLPNLTLDLECTRPGGQVGA
jgi:enoyl-CoA hydratase/carnithine racemase